jgi:murein DD-endopeptidase MepM/ murein hydrolase activator NlpD
MTLGGELMGNPLNFFDAGSGNYVALQGVHVMADPGYYPLVISGTMPSGAEFSYAQLVTVSEGGYNFETLTVDESYLDDEISDAETEFVNTIITQVSQDRLWETFFIPPSPYSDTINSYFGTRRSFNGSGFDYYHSGVDFGGGVGVEIFAPAPGVVVFAGPLEIRGNATIIDHGWGVFTGYWHQSEIKVQVGDRVEPGQVIGLVGNTGRSTGAHLHWEVWVGGIQVDGLDWLYNSFP